MSTATTRAPAATAIITAASPTPPQPCTATHSPARTPRVHVQRRPGRHEAAAQRRGLDVGQRRRHRDEVQVRARQRDVLGERAPGREPRLEVALADLRLALPARLADAAAAAERDRHAVADRPAADRRAHLHHRAAELVPAHVRQRDRRDRGPSSRASRCGTRPRRAPAATAPSDGHDGSGTSSIDERLLEGAHHGGAHRPIVASLDPLSLPPDELRRLGHHVWDRLVDRWEQLDAQPPIAPIDPDWSRRPASRRAPTGRATRRQAIDELFDAILPRGQRADHPRFFARIGSPSNPVSVLADLIGTGHNAFAGSWTGGAGRLGARAGHARLAARVDGDAGRDRGHPRQRRLGRHAHRARRRRARPRRGPRPGHGLRLRAHARRGGQGVAGARLQPGQPARAARPTPPTGCSRPRSRPRSHLDREAGLRPFLRRRHRRARPAPAASTRSTTSPTSPRSEGLWFHVDGAYGAPARLTASGKDLLTGIERADSLVLDPHKWLFQPYEIGAVLVRAPRPARSTRSRSTAPTCATASTGMVELRERGPQLTRSAPAR